MPEHRMHPSKDPWAIDFRSGSVVESEVEGDVVLSMVTYVSIIEPMTTTIVWPMDVLASFLNSLERAGLVETLPGLAKWIRDGHPPGA